MQAILTYPLYRRPKPTNKIAPYGYLQRGLALEVEDIIIGEKIDSSSVWYKASDGFYYWSGGFKNVAFTFPGKNFLELSLAQQSELASEAMDYYYEILAEKISGFTGMSVTFKKSNEQFREYYAMVIQVVKKSDAASWLVPDSLPYYGYAIPTDVTEALQTMPVGLGKSICRKTILSLGSAGFITTRPDSEEKILVTNYHVAFSDLMSGTPRQLAFTKGDSINQPEVVMPATDEEGSAVIGRVIEGRLDRFNDIALIQLDTDSAITNSIEFIGAINGIKTLQDIKENFRPETITVQMFGAKSHFKKGFIHSFNARQPIAYLGGDFVHVLKGLIQVSAMSQPGDSGSAVVDTTLKLVGMLVAADNHFSYIIPIENILRNFNLNQSL